MIAVYICSHDCKSTKLVPLRLDSIIIFNVQKLATRQ